MEVLATGHISLVDINDAIVSDVPPADPSLGALWIDTTKDPNTLNSWDGTNWVEQSLSISSLDPSFYQDVEKLKDFADKAGSDGIISSGEKTNIKLMIMEITGDVLSGQTLPTLATIDTTKGGQVYLARAEARASGIPVTHADYTAFETAYSDLKTYLESLTPRPWLTGDTTIDPVTWTAKWDAYYEKLSRLAVATSTYLANSIRPGEDYNGVTINTDKGIVVLRGDNLFRTILNATEGISIEKNNAGTWNKMFYTNLDGKIYAHGLVISSDSTIAGTPAGTVTDNAAKGKAGIDELTSDLKVTPLEKTQLSREWEAIKAEYTQVLAQATALGIVTSTYTTSYTNLDGVTPKIAAEVLATMTTTYTFASASARDAFRTKINSYFAESEKIKKAIYDAINKSAKDAEKNAKDYTNVIASNESSYINKNYNFADWTGSLPNGYSGLVGAAPTKVASENGNGNSIKFTTAAGQSGYFNTNTMNKPFYEYAYIEATIKLESGSINAAGVLFRYWRADGKSIYWDNAFKFKDIIPNPVLNKWYTVSKVVKVPMTDDFGGYGIFPMASWSTIDPTMPANVLYFDSLITRPATEQEISAYESKIAIADMTSDMKITPLEKQTLSRDWESIKAEYTQVLSVANSLNVPATAYTTSYTNLDSVSPKIASEVLANMNTTYAFVSAAARDLFKTQMNIYFSESEKIKRAINDAINNSANNANNKIDNLKVGGQNIVRKKQIVPINAASSSFDDPTNTWTLTINDGAGGSWGAGVRITDKFSVIPIGSWYTVSFDVYSPMDVTWSNDTNNFPIGTSSGTNDNDDVALRKNSSRNIKANTWTKCWFSYKNKDNSTTELYDQSNIGVINNTGAPLTFKIRNVKGELGSVATDFSLSQADIDDSIAKVQDNLDKLSIGGNNLLLDSHLDYSTTDYLINMYALSENWIAGQEYTFVIKGTVPAGQKFGIWQNGGSNKVGEATTTYADGITYVTFKAIATTAGNEKKLSLYNYPQNTTLATVDWVALYKGNKPMDWTIASGDIEKAIQSQLNGTGNLFTNSGDFKSLNGWVSNAGKSLQLAKKDGFSVLEAVGSIASTNTIPYPTIKSSTEYVYTVEIMFSKDTPILITTPIHFWFNDIGGNNGAMESNKIISSDTIAKANTWTRISMYFKTKPNISPASYFKAFIYGSQLTDDNKYWVKNVMFSETNRIVNWSPSLGDINEMISNISIGGRNIFLNSGLLQGTKYWYSNQSQTEIINDGSDKAFKFITNAGIANGGIYQRQGGSSSGAPPFEKDQEYTLSVLIKSSASGQKMNVGAEGISISVFDIGTEWKEYSFTFKGTGAGNGTIIFYSKSAPNGTQFFIKKMKLEKGNKKTDYTAAPEDTDQVISTIDQNVQNALKQGQVVVNSTFSNWTQAFPAGLGSWTNSTVSKETTLTRTGSAMRFDVPSDTAQIGAQITTGFFIPNLPNNKYYVVELDFMLVSGSITGACVLLDWNSMSPSRASIHLSDVVPAPTLGKWYTVRAVMKRPTDNLSGYSAMAGYLLANYVGSTTNKVKNIIFDRLVFREPTQQEIDAYEITTIENGVTVIDGGKLKTNSVKAESVDARRLRVTNNSGTVTLEITNTGEVTVNGKVSINSSSMFAPGYDPSKNDGGRNILLNSRFATADATSWNNWGSPSVRQIEDITDLPGFDKAVKLTTTAINQGLNQTVSVITGNTYTVSCYAKSASGQPVLQIYDGSGYPSVTMKSEHIGKNQWVKLFFTFTAKSSNVRVEIGKSAGGTVGTYWFTGIKLEKGDKTTGWTPAGEDADGLIGKVVAPNGDIKALDIASSMTVTPGAIDAVSKYINLKGKVTFSDFASGWALDSKGNKISNSDQPGYDPANPLYLDMDGNYRPLSDEKNFMSNLFTKDDTTGVTVIDGNYIKTGTIQAKYANFRDVQVYNDSGQQTFRIDTNGNLSTSGTSQSIGYERQKKGWKIDADGSAEFNAATFRGDIELGYYDAKKDSFVVTGGLLSGVGGTSKDLRFWAGANKSTAPFKVFSDGTLEATKGYFTGTFSGEVVVGNILIKDTATKGDAKIILTDDSKIQKVVLGESAVELNTKTTFGNFLTVDITNQKLDFGANDFRIDYKNNTIKMKNFSLKGTTALEFVSDGSSGDDFVFKNVTGDTSVRVDGSFIARDDIEITNVLRMKKSTDTGNKGIDYVFI